MGAGRGFKRTPEPPLDPPLLSLLVYEISTCTTQRNILKSIRNALILLGQKEQTQVLFSF